MENNSECVSGFLHDYRIVKVFPEKGILEVCLKCRDKKYFRNDTPNHVYLSFHHRSALQKNHPRYNKEYGQH